MKIYNKKTFCFGVFAVALGVLNVAADFVNKKWEVSGIVLAAALFFVGIGSLMRSLSRKMAREDKLEETDERNRLIALKSKSMSLRIVQAVSFLLMLILLIAGKVTGAESLIAAGVGLAFAVGISMFAEFFTSLYYEAKN